MGVRLDQRANVAPIEELRARRAMMELAVGRRRLRRKPRRQQLPRGQELRYRRLILEIIDAIAAQIEQDILPLVERLSGQVRQQRPDARFDAPADDITATAATLREGLSSTILSDQALDAAAEEIGRDIARFNRRQLDLLFEGSIGVGIGSTEPGLQDLLRGFVTDNVRLIRNVANDAVDKVEGTVLRGFRRGQTNREIAKGIEKDLETTRSRARLIARDQVASLNGELTQIRQTRMGVTDYIWRTAGDERVRPSHEALDGQRFTWAEGSDEGHPGEPISCRCIAEPVLDPLFEGL